MEVLSNPTCSDGGCTGCPCCQTCPTQSQAVFVRVVGVETLDANRCTTCEEGTGWLQLQGVGGCRWERYDGPYCSHSHVIELEFLQEDGECWLRCTWSAVSDSNSSGFMGGPWNAVWETSLGGSGPFSCSGVRELHFVSQTSENTLPCDFSESTLETDISF